MIPYGRQDISREDINAVVEVLKSDFLTQGPKVKEFEDKLGEDVKSELESLKDTRKLRILFDWAEKFAFDEVVVPDTNILIHSLYAFLAVWKQKCKGCRVGVLIPQKVIAELDGLKKGKGVTAIRARKANSAMQEHLKLVDWCAQSPEHKESIRKRHFSGISSDQMKRDGRPDDEIYYCWDEFREVSPCKVVFLSADNNFNAKVRAKKFERNAAILGGVQQWKLNAQLDAGLHTNYS